VKTIYLLRHAKAAAESPAGDAGRRLSKRGRKAAEAMGAFLGGLTPVPELALCSTAARTRETLDFVLPALHPAPKIVYEEELYLAEAEALLRRLRHLPKDAGSALLVGHNPGLQELGARLAADPGRLAEDFPTAALAVLRLPAEWTDLRWRRTKLALYRTPKELSPDHDREAD
jgi:phosphohistidine phosphatase